MLQFASAGMSSRDRPNMCRIRAAKSFTPVRPILMQLDLQSVEKVPFSSFAGAFAPKMLEIGLPRLSRSRSFPQDLSRAVFLFSRGPFAANHHQHFSDPTGSKYDYNIRSDRNNERIFDPMDNCNRI